MLDIRCRLFEEHGDLLGLFNKFRELKTKEQQASSEELAEHANKVMETLDEGIRSLDELDTFFEYLHQVGASHTRIAGFKSDYFWVSWPLQYSQIDYLKYFFFVLLLLLIFFLRLTEIELDLPHFIFTIDENDRKLNSHFCRPYKQRWAIDIRIT